MRVRVRARALTLTLTLTLHPNQARAEGNELFKAGNYPAAIEKCTDASPNPQTIPNPKTTRVFLSVRLFLPYPYPYP